MTTTPTPPTSPEPADAPPAPSMPAATPVPAQGPPPAAATPAQAQQLFVPGWQPPHGGSGAPKDAWGRPGAGQPSYTSPIEIRRTHLGHALASEWTKIRSVRSTMWTLGVFVLLVVGIGLLVASQTQDEDYTSVPYTIPAFFGLILGQICLITLGVLVISSEYGTGMIRTTFTASPQRHRVLAAKVVVYFLIAYTFSVLSVGFVGVVTSGLHPDGSSVAWQGSVFKGSLYVSLLGVLSLAVGSMLRHSAGAITAMLGLVLVPAIMPAFLYMSDSTHAVADKMMRYNAPNSLAQIFHLDSGTSSNGTSQLVLLLVVTAAALAGAFLLLERRDV
jgi:ABC-2 type transport system permease protein